MFYVYQENVNSFQELEKTTVSIFFTVLCVQLIRIDKFIHNKGDIAGWGGGSDCCNVHHTKTKK